MSAFLFYSPFLVAAFFRHSKQTFNDWEESNNRKRNKKRIADDEPKKKEKEALAEKLREYTVNNKTAATYTNLGVKDGILDTKKIKTEQEKNERDTVPLSDISQITADMIEKQQQKQLANVSLLQQQMLLMIAGMNKNNKEIKRRKKVTRKKKAALVTPNNKKHKKT